MRTTLHVLSLILEFLRADILATYTISQDDVDIF
jgi:hypothetical protein